MEERRKLNLDTIVIAVLFTNKLDDPMRLFLQEVRPHRVFVATTADEVQRHLMEENSFYRLEYINIAGPVKSYVETQVVLTVLGMTSRGMPKRIVFITFDKDFVDEQKIDINEVKRLFEEANAEVRIEYVS
jgi:hypothetical protein